MIRENRIDWKRVGQVRIGYVGEAWKGQDRIDRGRVIAT